jgi:hypothetical protein
VIQFIPARSSAANRFGFSLLLPRTCAKPEPYRRSVF